MMLGPHSSDVENTDILQINAAFNGMLRSRTHAASVPSEGHVVRIRIVNEHLSESAAQNEFGGSSNMHVIGDTCL